MEWSLGEIVRERLDTFCKDTKGALEIFVDIEGHVAHELGNIAFCLVTDKAYLVYTPESKTYQCVDKASYNAGSDVRREMTAAEIQKVDNSFKEGLKDHPCRDLLWQIYCGKTEQSEYYNLLKEQRPDIKKYLMTDVKR